MAGPVVVVEYDPNWVALYEDEKRRILGAIGAQAAAIEHIGSTAVPGLAAKPSIDILVGIRMLEQSGDCIQPLADIGYEYVPEYEAEIPERRYFHKGPERARTHHLHMVEQAGEFWKRHIAFRDYLRAHPDAAHEYAELKRRLAARYKWDRAGYTEAKSSFVEAAIARARGEGQITGG